MFRLLYSKKWSCGTQRSLGCSGSGAGLDATKRQMCVLLGYPGPDVKPMTSTIYTSWLIRFRSLRYRVVKQTRQFVVFQVFNFSVKMSCRGFAKHMQKCPTCWISYICSCTKWMHILLSAFFLWMYWRKFYEMWYWQSALQVTGIARMKLLSLY
jgi:hypothetical protein